MKFFPWEVMLLAGILAVNRLLVPATFTRPAAFWTIQAINFVGAACAAIFGLPGLDAYPSVRWLVSGVLVFHALQNIALRGRALDRAAFDEQERARIRASHASHASDQATPAEGADRAPEAADSYEDEPTRE